MVARITAAVSGQGLSEGPADEIEEILIQADVGVDAAMEIVDGLRKRMRGRGGQRSHPHRPVEARGHQHRQRQQCRRAKEGRKKWTAQG